MNESRIVSAMHAARIQKLEIHTFSSDVLTRRGYFDTDLKGRIILKWLTKKK